MEKKFSIDEALRFGWNSFRPNAGFFIGVLCLIGLIYFVPGIFSVTAKHGFPIFSSLIGLAGYILSLIVGMGFIAVLLHVTDKGKADFNDLFSCIVLFVPYYICLICSTLIIGLGFLLLVVPGIIFSIMFQFYPYLIIDKKLGPIEALRRSAAITRGVRIDLFVFDLILILINIAGAACFLVGLFVSIPVTGIAQAFVYRKLLAQNDTVATATSHFA